MIHLDGLRFLPGYFDRAAQQDLVGDIRAVIETVPLYRPVMPRSGRPFSVRMTNCGPLGWVADKTGYRYQPGHPETGAPWPAIPGSLVEMWADVAGCPAAPEACLINWYEPDAKMGLHQDRDEETFSAPIVSVSLGDDALFRVGGPERRGPTQSVRLSSGDVVVLGGAARLAFHGISRIYGGTSSLLGAPGRINLTLRRVTSYETR